MAGLRPLTDPPTCLALVPPIPGSSLEYGPYKTAKLSTQKAPDAHGVEARATKEEPVAQLLGNKQRARFLRPSGVWIHSGVSRGVPRGVPWQF